MSAGDMVRNSNSWHWLAAVVLLSAAGSVFAPGYGWKDALAYRSGRLEPQARKQAERLAALEALREDEAVRVEEQAAETKEKLRKCKAAFSAYGFEAIPQGEDAVFAAQSRVGAALAKRNVRLVSSNASVKGAAAGTPDAANRGRGASAARPSFRTAEIGYRASGDFRDIFMLLVGETHVRANYAFKDIAVTARDDDVGMDLSFTLQVNYR